MAGPTVSGPTMPRLLSSALAPAQVPSAVPPLKAATATAAPSVGATKVFHHPVVGDLVLDDTTLPLPADPGLSLTHCTAEPGTPSADGLAVLASWAATQPTRDDQLVDGQ